MNEWRVPLTDLKISEQDIQAVLECLESGWRTMGPRTQAFEQARHQCCGPGILDIDRLGTIGADADRPGIG